MMDHRVAENLSRLEDALKGWNTYEDEPSHPQGVVVSGPPRSLMVGKRHFLLPHLGREVSIS
jgi:hypothetical protein